MKKRPRAPVKCEKVISRYSGLFVNKNLLVNSVQNGGGILLSKSSHSSSFIMIGSPKQRILISSA